jgi:IS30 family transposase
LTDKGSTKNKHLSQEERQEIQDCLDHGMRFKAIGKRIGKDQTTISKEIKRHVITKESSIRRRREDGTPADSAVCPQLNRAPFVCNACSKRRYECQYNKQLYLAKHAQSVYETTRSESRQGTALNRESFYRIDDIITQGVNRGQHLYHIMRSNNLGVSKSTVYRHLHQGYLSISKFDMPRVVKFKPRKKFRGDIIPRAFKAGRMYDDFLVYTQDNDIKDWVEMDTVIGRPGGKVILTLHFTVCNFMIGLLLENKTSAEITSAITQLKQRLEYNGFCFGDVFPVILTDNGGEFANVPAIEKGGNGMVETRLFFCDPYQSSQKPHVEKNHTLFRDIVPKGESFDGFQQETVNLIFSHMNSVKRMGLNGKTAYEVFAFLFGERLACVLGIHPIPAGQVVQSPKLFKEK